MASKRGAYVLRIEDPASATVLSVGPFDVLAAAVNQLTQLPPMVLLRARCYVEAVYPPASIGPLVKRFVEESKIYG